MDAGILIPFGSFAMVVLLVWIQGINRKQKREQQAEIVRQVIDKFSSGEAFAQAIQGPEGSTLVQVLALENEERSKKKWKGLILPGSILTLLGIGFLVLSWTWSDDGDILFSEDFLIPAVVIGAPGLAILLSMYVLWRIEERGVVEADDSERERAAGMRISDNADTTGSL